MQYSVTTLFDNPEFLDDVTELNKNSWPEFLRHGYNPSWGRIFEELTDHLILLLNHNQELMAAGITIPVRWNGTKKDLPETIEDIILNGLESETGEHNTLMAIAALVDKQFRGQGLSADILKEMAKLAKKFSLEDLVVPVRPTWKNRYPLQSLENYVRWTRADGLYYDPWIRTHQRLGAQILTCVENTMEVSGTIRDWESWTGMIFPESGSYVVPGALQPVEVDAEDDRGVYQDPNVWMQHQL